MSTSIVEIYTPRKEKHNVIAILTNNNFI